MEGEQPPVLQQCFNTQVRVSWRTEGKADSDSEAHLPTVPVSITCQWRQGRDCNKPSKGLRANTLEGISLSQKEQMSFVTNGNGFSAQT